MTLHLIKLCVGCDSIDDLASWQAEWLRQRRKAGEKRPQLFHRTFQTPKRREELLAGGSLYWVIKGLVQVRQPLADVTEGTGEMARPASRLQERAVCARCQARVPGCAISTRRRRRPTSPPAAGIGAMPPGSETARRAGAD
jgi:hypothetical protein